MNIHNYAETVIENANHLISALNANGITTVNDIAYNHIILVDVSAGGNTGRCIEELLFNYNVLVNRNQIPNDKLSALITSGIRIGTVPITNLNYSKDDIDLLGKYLASVIKEVI